MVRQIAQKVDMESSQIRSIDTISTNETIEQIHMLILPYKGKQDNRTLRNIGKQIFIYLKIKRLNQFARVPNLEVNLTLTMLQKRTPT